MKRPKATKRGREKEPKTENDIFVIQCDQIRLLLMISAPIFRTKVAQLIVYSCYF